MSEKTVLEKAKGLITRFNPPQGLRADWDGTNHYEITAPMDNDGHFWLAPDNPSRNDINLVFECDSSEEEGQRLGYCLEAACLLPQLVAMLDRTDYMRRIEAAAKEAIEMIKRVPHCFKNEAVNWGCLYCMGVEHILNLSGQEGFRVLIRKANPSSREFCRFIENELSEKGFQNIEVVTEW